MRRTIEATLRAWQRVEVAAGAAQLRRNWRLQMFILRAHRDAYTAARAHCEKALETATLDALRPTTPPRPPAESLEAAIRAIGEQPPPGASCATANATVRAWRQRVVRLAAQINDTVGGEVVLTQAPDLGLRWLETPLSDVAYLNATLRAAAAIEPPDPSKQRHIIQMILEWDDPSAGGECHR